MKGALTVCTSHSLKNEEKGQRNLFADPKVFTVISNCFIKGAQTSWRSCIVFVENSVTGFIDRFF